MKDYKHWEQGDIFDDLVKESQERKYSETKQLKPEIEKLARLLNRLENFYIKKSNLFAIPKKHKV